jgi:hypothetical protein
VHLVINVIPKRDCGLVGVGGVIVQQNLADSACAECQVVAEVEFAVDVTCTADDLEHFFSGLLKTKLSCSSSSSELSSSLNTKN